MKKISVNQAVDARAEGAMEEIAVGVVAAAIVIIVVVTVIAADDANQKASGGSQTRLSFCHLQSKHAAKSHVIWIGGLLIGLTSTMGLFLLSRVSARQTAPLTEV